MTDVEKYNAVTLILSDLLSAMNEISLLKPDEFEFAPEIATNALIRANRAAKAQSGKV